MVQAAVVTAWGQPPKYETIELPEPTDGHERIRVIAAGLHNLVRGRAAGRHFSVANSSPPHIPGTDGVGTLVPSDKLVYFNCLTAPTGSFADEINVAKEEVFELPAGANADLIAVLANPAMSSWMALTARAGIAPGQKQGFNVAIVGATGVSGQAAVQIAKAIGAKAIVAIGKPGPKLERTKELGATATIPLHTQIEDTNFGPAAEVDVVLDYLWGNVAKGALPGIVAKRKNKSARLTWVEIGALAGENLEVSQSLLKKANVALFGCGPGSWTYPELHAQLPAMLRAMVDNQLSAEYEVKKLSDIRDWWTTQEGSRRLVKP